MKPLVVKGTEFYRRENCEAAGTPNWFRKEMHRRLKAGAQPMGQRSSRYGTGPYDLYRLSDTEPMPPRRIIPPRRIDVLVAIWVVNRSAKRHRDAARVCYEKRAYQFATRHSQEKDSLYRLKDDGIRYAHSEGRLDYVGVHAGMAVYEGEGFCFHSPSFPEGVLTTGGPSRAAVMTRGRFGRIPARIWTCGGDEARVAY